VVLMTAWHCQANAAVERARAWLADKAIRSVRINWRENVRKWHPGQQWIWQVGGFGVFDPGINGLSVATRILPFRPFVTRARLETPANRAMPIGAVLEFGGRGLEGPMVADFDWRETEGETWTVEVATSEGALRLTGGGRTLSLDGQVLIEHGDDEYPTLYRSLVDHVRRSECYVHADPLRIVADAFMLAERVSVEPFED
jgi:predicted dehydrogenase